MSTRHTDRPDTIVYSRMPKQLVKDLDKLIRLERQTLASYEPSKNVTRSSIICRALIAEVESKLKELSPSQK